MRAFNGFIGCTSARAGRENRQRNNGSSPIGPIYTLHPYGNGQHPQAIHMPAAARKDLAALPHHLNAFNADREREGRPLPQYE
jgi:hypothetical protein